MNVRNKTAIPVALVEVTLGAGVMVFGIDTGVMVFGIDTGVMVFGIDTGSLLVGTIVGLHPNSKAMAMTVIGTWVKLMRLIRTSLLDILLTDGSSRSQRWAGLGMD
jgi:hypothetical protein